LAHHLNLLQMSRLQKCPRLFCWDFSLHTATAAGNIHHYEQPLPTSETTA